MRQQAVVRNEELMTTYRGPEHVPGSAHARINHDEVQRVRRKGEAGLAEKPTGPADVVWNRTYYL